MSFIGEEEAMPVVSIVGRPNVGKSSLFNRLLGRREAIVDDMPGVTRDRLYGEVEWKDKKFFIVDTGGFLARDENEFVNGMRFQIRQAIEESDLVLFVIDGREGPTWMDEDVAEILRRSGKPVIVVANKIDDGVHEDLVLQSYSLGFPDVIGVSAEHKRYIYDLQEAIVSRLPHEDEEAGLQDAVRVAIVGRPNVGKSSLLNRFAGEERALVSDIPGTTRDAIDTIVTIDGRTFNFVDTAGIRRKSRVEGDIEYYSFVRALQAVDRSDIVLLVMDSREPFTDQDKKLAALVIERGKGVVPVLNKWDLLGSDPKLGDTMKKKFADEMVFIKHAPILFASALTGRGLNKMAGVILGVQENRGRRIATTQLNRMLRDILAFDTLPTDRKGRALKLFYCTQAGVNPPSFVFFVNSSDLATKAFANHIEKEIRGLGDFSGTPIRIFWRNRASD